jgi:MoaA/NifB/PqqE/SkfB family radical SAM enzyme
MNILNKIRRHLSRDVSPKLQERLTRPPRTFFLELTNHCNLRCSMCNFHAPSVKRSRAKGFMSEELAVRTIEEICAMEGPKPWVALHGAGEPLLHRSLVDILRKTSHREIDIGFLTNAVLLNEEISRKILDAGISWIGFSIDGIVKEKFAAYRRGADYDLVVKNTLRFLDLAAKRRSDLKTMVNMTMQEEMKGDVPTFVEFWLRAVNEVCVSPCRPVGLRNNQLARDFELHTRMPCYMLFTMMVVYWDGGVGLCCEDWFNDGKMGHLRNESLEEIWRGRQFSCYRSLHEEGKYDGLTLCRDCNSWNNAIPQESFDEELGCHVAKTAWQYRYFL